MSEKCILNRQTGFRNLVRSNRCRQKKRGRRSQAQRNRRLREQRLKEQISISQRVTPVCCQVEPEAVITTEQFDIHKVSSCGVYSNSNSDSKNISGTKVTSACCQMEPEAVTTTEQFDVNKMFSVCSNNSSNSENVSGTTFHKCPVDFILREKWVNALPSKDCLTSNYSKPCSANFTEDHRYMSEGNQAHLKDNVVPSITEDAPSHIEMVIKVEEEETPEEVTYDSSVNSLAHQVIKVEEEEAPEEVTYDSPVNSLAHQKKEENSEIDLGSSITKLNVKKGKRAESDVKRVCTPKDEFQNLGNFVARKLRSFKYEHLRRRGRFEIQAVLLRLSEEEDRLLSSGIQDNGRIRRFKLPKCKKS